MYFNTFSAKPSLSFLKHSILSTAVTVFIDSHLGVEITNKIVVSLSRVGLIRLLVTTRLQTEDNGMYTSVVYDPEGSFTHT